jgi:transcriptional regulator with XRE-family HTH domain
LIKVSTIMSREHSILFPSLRRLLAELGENIRLARLRRKFPASLVAERAGISRNTLRAIERGEPSVTFGSYVNVLHSLGLEQDLRMVAKDDVLGRKLQDAGLPTKARAPRSKLTPAIKKEK